MKSPIVFLVTIGAILSKTLGLSTYETIFSDYHLEIGIPEAKRIKLVEDEYTLNPDKIVGGSSAAAGQLPYQAGLVVTLTTGSVSVCGASLLSNTRLLTAAHCWRHGSSQARQFVVVLASQFLFSGGTRIPTASVEVHSGYNQRTMTNDLAMIGISGVSFNAYIQPIALPPLSVLNQNLVGATVLASGYGKTHDASGITNNQYLSKTQLRVITNAECQRAYGPSTVVSTTICTSGEGGRGTCGGDSGGPVAGSVNGHRFLAGVVSFGSSQGCQVGLPAGHSRVTAYIYWILARL